MKQTEIEIEITPSGRGRVLVDGKDISMAVSGIEVRCFADEAPKVTLDIVRAHIKVHARVANTEFRMDPFNNQLSIEGERT